jgi:hypothetical protein
MNEDVAIVDRAASRHTAASTVHRPVQDFDVTRLHVHAFNAIACKGGLILAKVIQYRFAV